MPAARHAAVRHTTGPELEMPAGPLSAQQLTGFELDGFLNGGAMLAPAELTELETALDAV